MKYLLKFNNSDEFINYTTNWYNIKNWFIDYESFKSRAYRIKDTNYFKTLQKLFLDSNLSYKSSSDEQIISILDSLHFIDLIIDKLNTEYKNELNIILEYEINDISKSRIDYTLVYRNSIILIEFSYTYEENMKQVYKNKLNQINSYKLELQNILPNSFSINTFVFIYSNDMFTYNKNISTCNNISNSINNIFNNQVNYLAIDYLLRS